MRYHLLRVSLCVLALALAGCASYRPPETSATMLDETEEGSAWAYFLDTGDDGDDPWTPGCHFKCSDAECSGEMKFWGGDFCSGNDLQEWTNNGPHAAESDITRHDCETECKAKGSGGGRCVAVQDACDGAYQSSRCECDDASEG